MNSDTQKLRATEITKSYGKVQVLKDINLDITPGTITTLIGPSGSGKSTLLRAFSLLDPPDNGTISFSGTNYVFVNGKGDVAPSPWPDITVVFQQLFLWPHMTLRQNIMLPLKKRGIKKNDRVICELIDQLEMSSFADRYPNEVSIGQRQLAAIARALALKPKFLLLDEITSALDVEYVSTILEKLNQLKSEGIGILLITHIIGFAKRSADQVVFLDKGEIVESGGTEILTKPESDRMKEFLSLMISAH